MPVFWRRLVYRWCVEFNPMYLLSAALVLGGCFLLSRGIASGESLWATLGLTAVSEVYAFSLMGGAALLMRIGRRRPAVMLALLSLLYLWDMTLHTETSAYLGTAGMWVVGLWFAAFVAKVHGFAWALRVRFARRVTAAALLAAIGLALGPRWIPELGARHAGELVAVWCFVLGALYRSSGGVESAEVLSPWGRTVLARVTRAAWWVSGVLVGAHVLFWTTSHGIALSLVLPVMPLLYLRGVRSEGRAWVVVLGTLAVVALALPSALAVTALVSAAALVLRALSPTFGVDAEPAPTEREIQQPYRWSGAPASRVAAVPAVLSGVIAHAEQMRAFTGAFSALYLAAWTRDWAGGPWPAHLAVLDAALTLGAFLAVWKLHLRSPLVPLAACHAHLVAHVVPAPRGAFEWGLTSVTLGFALLFGSLAASYRFRLQPVASMPLEPPDAPGTRERRGADATSGSS